MGERVFCMVIIHAFLHSKEGLGRVRNIGEDSDRWW